MRLVSFSLAVLAIVSRKVRVIYGGNQPGQKGDVKGLRDLFEGKTRKGVHEAPRKMRGGRKLEVFLEGMTGKGVLYEEATAYRPIIAVTDPSPSLRDQIDLPGITKAAAAKPIHEHGKAANPTAELERGKETTRKPLSRKGSSPLIQEIYKKQLAPSTRDPNQYSVQRVADQLKLADVQPKITAEGATLKKEKSPVHKIYTREDVMIRLIDFISSAKEYLPTWNHERGEPPCFWEIGKDALVGMQDNQKLSLVSLQYKTDESYRSLSEILFNFKPIKERKQEIIGSRIKGPFIYLHCPTFLDDPQFKDLIEAAVFFYKQIETEYESPLEQITLEKEDNSQGRIVLRFPPLNPEDTEQVFTIFDPSSAMADAIRAEGREVMKGGKWGIQPNRDALLSDNPYTLILTDLKNQYFSLPCPDCPISKGLASSRMNLRMYLAIFGFPGFEFHPGRGNIKKMGRSLWRFLSQDALNREKLISLEKLLHDVKNISIGDLKVMQFDGKPKDGLLYPTIRGIAFDELPTGGGYLFVSGKNGIGVARVKLTGGAEAVPDVFHQSPYYDIFYLNTCIRRSDAYECKVGDTKVNVKLGAADAAMK